MGEPLRPPDSDALDSRTTLGPLRCQPLAPTSTVGPPNSKPVSNSYGTTLVASGPASMTAEDSGVASTTAEGSGVAAMP